MGPGRRLGRLLLDPIGIIINNIINIPKALLPIPHSLFLGWIAKVDGFSSRKAPQGLRPIGPGEVQHDDAHDEGAPCRRRGTKAGEP